MIKNALRQKVEALLDTQLAHPVWPRVEVMWDQPYDIGSLWIRTGSLLEQVSPDEIVKRIKARNLQIDRETTDPLRYQCEPDMWRRIDMEMCRKRLAHPGMVLELLVTGGIRPGKTEGATRRGMAHFLYTRNAWAWWLHETDTTSRTIQQKRVYRFFPPDLKPGTGRMKKDQYTKFNYSEGTGFTGQMFNFYWNVKDADGTEMECGGESDFRFYQQNLATLQGAEITFATSDELVPLNVVKTVKERLTTRAADTAAPQFLAKIRQALKLLEEGKPLPLALMGAVYHSTHLITFTPKEGWNMTISSFLQGAKKYDWEVGELLVGVPGVKDPRVPRFAQPVDPLRLVAYLHTADNVIKPAYPAVRKQLEGRSETEIRITAYGDVSKDWQTQFPAYSDEDHVKTWKDVPRDGTIYEICDPGGRKPWVVTWIMCDVAGRHWVLQEWPCESIEIEGRLCGPWAVPSESEKRNGDAGPAQRLSLRWNRAAYTRMLYQGRARLARKFVESGGAFNGHIEKAKLTWKGHPEWTLEGEFVEPLESIMDSRYAGASTENNQKDVVTVLEAMADEENGILFIPASGDSLYEGDLLIQNELTSSVLGLPALMVLNECTNTRFMFSTYSLPEFRENTKATDEACKDFRDPIAYYLLSGPVYVPKPTTTRRSGKSCF